MYTKKKLTEIWERWNKKKEALKHEKKEHDKAQIPSANKVEAAPAQPATPAKPVQNQHRPQFAAKKEGKPAEVTNDMLEQLKMKFGK